MIQKESEVEIEGNIPETARHVQVGKRRDIMTLIVKGGVRKGKKRKKKPKDRPAEGLRFLKS